MVPSYIRKLLKIRIEKDFNDAPKRQTRIEKDGRSVI
jgi:hypothetical protein